MNADEINEDAASTQRPKFDQKVSPSVGTFYTALPDLDWGPDGRLVHPPERVVQVCVISDLTCITVAKYDEDGGTSTCTAETEVAVDTRALLAALVSQLDADVAEAALRLHHLSPAQTPSGGAA